MRSFRVLITLFLMAIVFFYFPSCGGGAKGDKIYKIGRDKSFYPLQLMGKENNLLGFTDELLFAIAEREGFDIDLESSAYQNVMNSLNLGRDDAVVTFDNPTFRLEQRYEFSDPFFFLGPVIIVQTDSDINSFKDLENKVVAVERNSTTLSNVKIDFPIIFTPFDNVLAALRQVASGQIDAVILDAIEAFEYTQSFYKNNLVFLIPPITDEGLRLATLKTEEGRKLIEMFNTGLRKMREDHSYRELLFKWDLAEKPPEGAEVVKPQEEDDEA